MPWVTWSWAFSEEVVTAIWRPLGNGKTVGAGSALTDPGIAVSTSGEGSPGGFTTTALACPEASAGATILIFTGADASAGTAVSWAEASEELANNVTIHRDFMPQRLLAGGRCSK